MYQVDAEHLERFDPKLKRLLEAEIAAGNKVLETGSGFPLPRSIVVRMEKPFTVAIDLRPGEVVYRLVNDPHWWKDEFESNGHMLVSGM